MYDESNHIHENHLRFLYSVHIEPYLTIEDEAVDAKDLKTLRW